MFLAAELPTPQSDSPPATYISVDSVDQTPCKQQTCIPYYIPLNPLHYTCTYLSHTNHGRLAYKYSPRARVMPLFNGMDTYHACKAFNKGHHLMAEDYEYKDIH